MHALELKVPPPAVMLAFALLMWVVSWIGPVQVLSESPRVIAAVLIGLAGGVVSLSGMHAFRRAKTTVNPMKPQNTAALVTSGIYRRTRNPMYLGLLLLLVLVAWAVYLAAALTWLGPFFFVAYIQRFQILPEERALQRLFGDEFARYKSKVRRWF